MDSAAKRKWERENVLTVTVKVNRNQDPVFYDALRFADNRAGLIRSLCTYHTLDRFVIFVDSDLYEEYLRNGIYRVPADCSRVGLLFRVLPNDVLQPNDYVYGRYIEGLCEDLHFDFYHELYWLLPIGHTFRVRNEFVDSWAVDESFVDDPVVTSGEIVALVHDWGVSLNELMEQVIPID